MVNKYYMFLIQLQRVQQEFVGNNTLKRQQTLCYMFNPTKDINAIKDGKAYDGAVVLSCCSNSHAVPQSKATNIALIATKQAMANKKRKNKKPGGKGRTFSRLLQ